MHFRTRLFPCLLAALANFANAQTQVEVRGSADAYDARKDDTATKIVVDARELTKYGDSSIGEALKRQPGITVGRGNSIQMRGLGNGYTQVLVDGQALPPGFALDAVSPDTVERIEIMRAASADLSTQAIAGTVNIILKKTVRAARRELKLNVNGNSAFVSSGANAEIADKGDTFSYVVTGRLGAGKFDQPAYREDELFDAAGASTLRRSSTGNDKGDGRSLALTPRLTWILDADNTLTSSTFFNAGKYDRVAKSRWSAPPAMLPIFVAESAASASSLVQLKSDLNWVRKFGGAKLDTKLGISAGERDDETDQRGVSSADTPILARRIDARQSDRSATFVGKLTMPLGEGHSVAAGWDASRSKGREWRRQREQPIDGVIPADTDERNGASVSRLAAFFQDDWVLGPRWSAYIGLRWEGLRTATSASAYAAVRNTASVWSPLLQTLWRIPGTASDQLRLAVTRTYKAPALDQLLPRRTIANNNSATTPDTLGNPALRPELAWGVDAAFEHIVDKGALLSASVFARRIDDAIGRDTAFSQGRWTSVPVNRGRADVRGIELEAKFPLSAYVKGAKGIDVRVNVARNWSSIDTVPGPDNRLAEQVPYNANLGLDYRVSDMLSGGATFTLRGGGPIRLSATQETYATIKRELDIYALWKISPRTQLRMSALNLLGQDFIFIERYLDQQGSARMTSVERATPLLSAALELKF